MKSIILIFLFQLFSDSLIFSQNSLRFQEIESAVGTCSISLISTQQNPARLGYLKGVTTTAAVSPSKFNLSELTPITLITSYRLSKLLNTGINLSGLTSNLYKEISGAGIIDFTVFDFINLGTSITYSMTSIKNFNSNSSYIIDLGGLIKITDFLSSGFCIRNITRSGKSDDGRIRQQKVLIGCGINPAENLFVDVDAAVDLSKSTGISAACKYQIEDVLQMRLAASTEPRSAELGVLIIPIRDISVSMLVNYHLDLQISKYIAVSYHW